jgi:hypothetical protein
MKDWVEAIIAAICLTCFVVFCTYIIAFSFPV